jgi:hypothetical protein
MPAIHHERNLSRLNGLPVNNICTSADFADAAAWIAIK